MNGIQYLLPAKAQAYAKAIVALLVSVLASLSVVLDAPAWVTVATAVLTPLLVVLQSNATEEDEPGRHAAPPGSDTALVAAGD